MATLSGNTLVVLGKVCKASSLSTRHNTPRTYAAVQAFLASGPQTLDSVKQMLAVQFGHGCWPAYAVKSGWLVAAPKGTQAGPSPVWPNMGTTIALPGDARYSLPASASTALVQHVAAAQASMVAAHQGGINTQLVPIPDQVAQAKAKPVSKAKQKVA